MNIKFSLISFFIFFICFEIYAGCDDQPSNEVDWTNCNFVEEVDLSLKKACEKFKEVQIVEYTVGPKIINKKGRSHHQWLIEFKTKPKNLALFEKEIDINLQKRNTYYKDLIEDKVLSTLKIKEVKRKSFINFMKSIGKLGGQNKVPRLSNDDKLINQILKLN